MKLKSLIAPLRKRPKVVTLIVVALLAAVGYEANSELVEAVVPLLLEMAGQ